jgi:poly(3-hydroxybutyrate) depolymerase
VPARAPATGGQLNRRDDDGDNRPTARLVTTLERRVCVDRRRVYLTGVSNRGGFPARAACELASRVAAIVPIAGSYKALDLCPLDGPRVALLEIHDASAWRFVRDKRRRKTDVRA